LQGAAPTGPALGCAGAEADRKAIERAAFEQRIGFLAASGFEDQAASDGKAGRVFAKDRAATT
jgi:hypothetical protein